MRKPVTKRQTKSKQTYNPYLVWLPGVTCNIYLKTTQLANVSRENTTICYTVNLKLQNSNLRGAVQRELVGSCTKPLILL